jgi:hypothetical protein
VEINSSFYRPHQSATYARWRDATPAPFRFSVKMPRSVTHESHLKGCAAEVARFYEDIAALQPKLAAVLVQLPPSLEFNRRTVRTFFNSCRAFAERGGMRAKASELVHELREQPAGYRESPGSPPILPVARRGSPRRRAPLRLLSLARLSASVLFEVFGRRSSPLSRRRK